MQLYKTLNKFNKRMVESKKTEHFMKDKFCQFSFTTDDPKKPSQEENKASK